MRNDINIVVFPIACGVTADNTPNVVIENPRTNQLMSLWHYTSFYEKEAALEYLKDVFRDGIQEDDIGLESDNALWLTMDELKEVKND